LFYIAALTIISPAAMTWRIADTTKNQFNQYANVTRHEPHLIQAFERYRVADATRDFLAFKFMRDAKFFAKEILVFEKRTQWIASC
jgi:hypothetical protein